MTEIIKNGIDVLEKGFESLKSIKKDKREYKKYLARIKALPEDYQYVYQEIARYLWSYAGGGDGYDMLAVQTGLVELFEASAAEGKHVLEVTGEDVAGFSDELLRNARNYLDDRRAKLNNKIAKKVGKSDESPF